MAVAAHRIAGTPLVGGPAKGIALVTDEPLSFWGGVDPNTGIIIDRRHPLAGQSVQDRILVLPFGRGSCSASGVLLESIWNRTSPAGIIVGRIDPIIGLGAILGDEMTGRVVPVVLVAEAELSRLRSGNEVTIARSGLITVGA